MGNRGALLQILFCIAPEYDTNVPCEKEYTCSGKENVARSEGNARMLTDNPAMPLILVVEDDVNYAVLI